jgi:hypothetical protein
MPKTIYPCNVRTTTGEDARKDFRNADTVEVMHPKMAAEIWARLSEAVETTFEVSEGMDRWQRDIEGQWKPYGTSDHVLFARYATGGHFAPHTGKSVVGVHALFSL